MMIKRGDYLLVDGTKLKVMVEEFCIDKRPKSIDILNMIDDCKILNEPILQPKEFECKDHSDNSKVCDVVKLSLAEDIFTTMLENMESISIKDFIQHIMYLYGFTEYDILQDKRLL